MSIELGDFVNFKFQEQVYVGGKVQKITTQIMGGFIFYDIDYQNKRIMTVSELNVTFLERPKFKVGEWVKLNCFAYPKYHGLEAKVINTSISAMMNIHYDVEFYKKCGENSSVEKVNFVKEDLLEKNVNPKIDIKTTITTKEFLESVKCVMREEKYNYDKYILGVRSPVGKDIIKDFYNNTGKTITDGFIYHHFSLEDKKRLPDEVIFKDGKTTLLFSVKNDGKAPYVSYSSKVAKGDTFDKEFGFLITYLKYLKDNYKVVLQECFDFKGNARLSFLYGVVRQLCENNNIDVADLNNYAIHILNNDRYTLKQYNDWKRAIETKAKRYTEVVNEIETKEKELDKLKKQKENLK